MAPTKYIVLDTDEGRLAQQAGIATYIGGAAAGRLVSLNDDGVINAELLPTGEGGDSSAFENPMTTPGDIIVGGAETTFDWALSASFITVSMDLGMEIQPAE